MTPQLPTMTPQEFIDRWRDARFGERQGAQPFFIDLCAVVGHPTPAAYGDPERFTFEKWVPGGFADAYFEEHFGWEFKGLDAQLDGAFDQLLRYQVHLKTPPLLIVSSFQTIRIQTNFPGMETARYDVGIGELEEPDRLELVRDAFFAPHRFRERLRSVDSVNRETASLFQSIVEDMESRNEDPERLARYLNQLVFCLYSEDAGLLPNGLFSRIVTQHYRDAADFDEAIQGLFGAMGAGRFYGPDRVAHFNGDLFNTVDTVELSTVALQRLGEACKSNWRDIEPSIFGTLFERALDASKRAQTGAHYTGADDIQLVVEPVVMKPLRREWETVRQEIDELLERAEGDAAKKRLDGFRQRLGSAKVLDPACGSGNFLYIALRSLLDLEREVIDFGAVQGWDGLTPTVQPNQMLGLEINHYAAELARTALWIGYIQWHQANGFQYTQRPILTPLDTIRQTDAILDLTEPEHPVEPEWPAAEFIVGNPPFLGGKLLQTGLSDDYVDQLFRNYDGQVAGEADLVCYWFYKAHQAIEAGKAKRAGLLATQGIRGGANRRVLQRIKETGDIFMAWSDRPWILEGAAVHTSIVGFDDGSDTERKLDGRPVDTINANLTGAKRLAENAGTAFMGDTKGGPFDIPGTVAQEMLESPNPDGRNNSDVVRPWVNGRDITDRSRGMWIVDFGEMTSEEAALYEAPFEYANQKVRPQRERSRSTVSKWWLHERPRPDMKKATQGTNRYIVTPRVSKHRLFAWIPPTTVADSATIVIARDDDYTFGVLHSRFHELWARGMGTQLREVESGFRYTPTTCFETFPFPRPTDEQREKIGAVAAELNQLREGWLNPDGIRSTELRGRTLTTLYNERPTWLDNIHTRLDAAVAEAYAWPTDLPESEVLEQLLVLNLSRATRQRSYS